MLEERYVLPFQVFPSDSADRSHGITALNARSPRKTAHMYPGRPARSNYKTRSSCQNSQTRFQMTCSASMLTSPALFGWLIANLHSVSRKGVADELLSKQEKERGRKRDLDDDVELLDGRDHSRKRARSLSSDSSSSVSTISTSSSHSESPKPRRRYDTRGSRERSPERTSPSPRGSRPRKRRYSDSASEYSYSSGSPVGRRHSRSRERERERDRNTRRRHRESSPEERGRRNDSARRGSWRDRSRSQSMDKSRIARDRRSMTPETLRGPGHHASTRRSPYGESRPPRESSYQYPERQRSERGRRDRDGPSVPSPRRERSLSPYSKRLALTQAMSMGR